MGTARVGSAVFLGAGGQAMLLGILSLCNVRPSAAHYFWVGSMFIVEAMVVNMIVAYRVGRGE